MVNSRTILNSIMLAACLVSSRSISMGQEERVFPHEGTFELAGTIAYANYTQIYQGEKGDAISLISFSPQLGYFITENFEIGLSSGVVLLPGLSLQSQGGTSYTALQLFLTPAYNFQSGGGKLTPFIEAQLGYTSLAFSGEGVTSRSGFSYGGRGGIKFVPVEHFILTCAVQYLSINLKATGETERTGYNYFTIGVGVGAYF
jgi:hypothetical protein